MSRTDSSGQDGLRAVLNALDPDHEGQDMVIARLADSADRLADPQHRGNRFAWRGNAQMLRNLITLLAEHPTMPTEETAEVAHHYEQGSDEGNAYSRGWHNGYDSGWDAHKRSQTAEVADEDREALTLADLVDALTADAKAEVDDLRARLANAKADALREAADARPHWMSQTVSQWLHQRAERTIDALANPDAEEEGR